MPTDPKLERYLSSLDRALAPLLVSERADILIEIKSHVSSALERDPQLSMDRVLAALGEPETVANRYLMERGKAPVKPPISPIVKWLVVGFLGTVAMVLFFVAFLAVKFSDKLDLDSTMKGGSKGRYEGTFAWKSGETRPLVIQTVNSKIDLETASGSDFAWNCKGIAGKEPTIREDEKAITLDFGGVSSVKCELKIPENAQLSMDILNGKLAVSEPRFHLNAKLGNGKVSIQPDHSRSYRYDLSVMSGKVDDFESSKDESAYRISVNVSNGVISNEE